MKKSEEAVMKHSSGYNCAQAVACAFADKIGVDEQELFRLADDARTAEKEGGRA